MTSLELIVLGLIHEKASYGYEIEENIRNRRMRDWTEIGFSSIYNTLNKLEKKGLIQSTVDKKYGTPERKVYSITKEGQCAFLREIETILSTAQPWINSLDIGLCFANVLAAGVFENCLRNYQRSLMELKARFLKARELNCSDQLPANIQAIFSHQFHFIESEIAWVEKQQNIIE